MRRERDAAALLGRALLASGKAAGCAVELADMRSRNWVSATFAGERVTLTLRVANGAKAWLAGLPEAELPLPGCFVAELEVSAGEDGTAFLEALILWDA